MFILFYSINMQCIIVYDAQSYILYIQYYIYILYIHIHIKFRAGISLLSDKVYHTKVAVQAATALVIRNEFISAM
jgi:hypothetical protein